MPGLPYLSDTEKEITFNWERGLLSQKKVVNAMKNAISLLTITVFSLAALLAGCGNSEQAESEPESSSSVPIETSPESQIMDSETMEEEKSIMNMIVQVGGTTFTATLEENAAVDALVEMMEQGPVTIQMSDYSGFEKVGPLGTSLPTSNQQTTTQAGDIVLYQGNQIVMFYGSNSWSYTRLGHIDDLTGWEEALGSGDVAATFFRKHSKIPSLPSARRDSGKGAGAF